MKVAMNSVQVGAFIPFTHFAQRLAQVDGLSNTPTEQGASDNPSQDRILGCKHRNDVDVWRRSKEALNVGGLDCAPQNSIHAQAVSIN